jgi:hypothetical protein
MELLINGKRAGIRVVEADSGAARLAEPSGAGIMNPFAERRPRPVISRRTDVAQPGRVLGLERKEKQDKTLKEIESIINGSFRPDEWDGNM